jgi:hypothetical protein
MRISLRLLGREVLALDVVHGAGQLEPAESPPPVPAESAEFGFWGGAGGIQEHNWQPDTRRPLEADR